MLAVALHDVEPATFERCVEIREWLGARGIERITLLVIPAPRLHPFDASRPDLADWLRFRVRAGDAVAQHGLQHLRRRGRRLPGRALGNPSAEFAGLDFRETHHTLDAGLRVLRRAGLAPRGFVAPAYHYPAHLRREVRQRFAWWATPWRIYGPEIAAPALGLGASSAQKRTLSPALLRAGAFLGGRVLRLDVRPVDFDRARHLAALEWALERAAEREVVTYDELARRAGAIRAGVPAPTASSSRGAADARAARRRAARSGVARPRAAEAPPPRPR